MTKTPLRGGLVDQNFTLRIRHDPATGEFRHPIRLAHTRARVAAINDVECGLHWIGGLCGDFLAEDTLGEGRGNTTIADDRYPDLSNAEWQRFMRRRGSVH